MKKGLLTIGAFLCLTMTINAQVDTLSEFFTGTPTLYGVSSGGIVSGSNSYGDLAKMQLFDNTNGVTSGGTITGVALWVPTKSDAGGSFDVAIWSNVSGAPSATPIGTKTITIASVDTTSAGLQIVGGTAGYNVVATFTTPIAIPSGNAFWAGIVLPTTAGDSVSVIQNTEGDYADSLHSGEIWSDGSFNLFKTSWSFTGSVALGFYPIVNFTAGSIVENDAVTATIFPNPANDVLNFKLNGNASAISILSLDGKVISSQEVNQSNATVNVSNLVSGIYMYQITSANGTVTTNKFVKK